MSYEYTPAWRTVHESEDGRTMLQSRRDVLGAGSCGGPRFRLRLCMAGHTWIEIELGNEEKASTFVESLARSLGFGFQIYRPDGSSSSVSAPT